MAETDLEETDRDEGDYALDPATVDAILEAVAAGDGAAIDAAMEPLHAADIADLILRRVAAL